MTAGCQQCMAYAAEIATLNQALEGAVFVLGNESEKLRAHLCVTKQQAELLVIFARAGRRWLDWRTLDDALPESTLGLRSGPTVRQDPDYRSDNFVRQTVFYIRARLGKDFVESKQWQGYRLSEPALKRVRALLKEAL